MDAAGQGDWPAAIDAAGKALTRLAGDDVRHYRALWQYVLASWAVIAARAGERDQWLRWRRVPWPDDRIHGRAL